MNLSKIRDPRFWIRWKASGATTRSFVNIHYKNMAVPETYYCNACGRSGCKLWREGGTFSDAIRLLCAGCAGLDQQADISSMDAQGCYIDELGKSDQIGAYVPAIPLEDNVRYWGYGAAPRSARTWWQSLPTFFTRKTEEQKAWQRHHGHYFLKFLNGTLAQDDREQYLLASSRHEAGEVCGDILSVGSPDPSTDKLFLWRSSDDELIVSVAATPALSRETVRLSDPELYLVGEPEVLSSDYVRCLYTDEVEDLPSGQVGNQFRAMIALIEGWTLSSS